MKLQKPTKKFISEILQLYSTNEANELNDNLLKLFKTFDDDTNKYNVLIKVAALNKIYSTAITNIYPIVELINNVSIKKNKFQDQQSYVDFVDLISKVEWTNSKGKSFKRNNLSFSSKFVHFLSEYETPIYDSYIWIVIKGYLGQKKGESISFGNPKSFQDFHITFIRFKTEFNLLSYSNYEVDKFLWQYGKLLIQNIGSELSLDLNKSKSELKRRIKAYRS